MAEQTVTIATRTGPLDVPALFRAGPLAVTPSGPGTDPGGYAVTHVPTGCGVTAFPRRDQAERFVRLLAEDDTLDWSFSFADAHAPTAAYRRVVDAAHRAFRAVTEDE